MKRPKSGSTLKQYAYAQRRLGGEGQTKQEMALLSGYSPKVAKNVKDRIENTEGYKNAIIELAHKSNNLLLATYTEFEARGLQGFSDSDLIKALNAISSSWERIETARAPDKMKTAEGNPLRAIFTQRVETRTAVLEQVPQSPAAATPSPSENKEEKETVRDAEVVVEPLTEDDMDF